ncbi:hydroxyacylglutathione hydrolase [Rhodococcus gordoniae]|uniref:Hydroxyacylglutathione hydrolase n=1 Tax=Rhodococcus gordoniae TaxID=223392 RepID=A0A379M277_9NOCA|nr:MBL fold metallo-hydrolase [Rhodococcus gordoniae]SUE16454.1 hydroxyacylglutathione hydrolase [Rhodococcus gordoniae]
MRQILPDLWETQEDNPFPGLRTHAYLWTGKNNVLFYSVAGEADFDALDRLGGITDQYLSHQDEAGPMLGRIAERFGSRLHAAAAEADVVGRHARIDVPLTERHVDDNGLEIVPTPGHTVGSICYVVPGADGTRYLFTGDTLYCGASGKWQAGYIEGMSDARALADSLRLLATTEPDVVISSAFAGESGVHRVDPREWPAHIDQALTGLSAAVQG